MPKVRFLEECEPKDGSGTVYEKGKVYDLPEPSVQHWERRGKIERVRDNAKEFEPAQRAPEGHTIREAVRADQVQPQPAETAAPLRTGPALEQAEADADAKDKARAKGTDDNDAAGLRARTDRQAPNAATTDDLRGTKSEPAQATTTAAKASATTAPAAKETAGAAKSAHADHGKGAAADHGKGAAKSK